jgi:type II secretory pathway component PulM
MTRFARIASVAVLAGLVGCGKSPEQQQVEQIQKNAQQMAQSAAQMSGNAQDVARGFEAMGERDGRGSDGRHRSGGQR